MLGRGGPLLLLLFNELPPSKEWFCGRSRTLKECSVGGGKSSKALPDDFRRGIILANFEGMKPKSCRL